MGGKIEPIKIAKICANDGWPLIYLPKLAVERLGLRVGRRILISLDPAGKLIIQPIE